MYNTDYLPQLENSRRHLFGNFDPRNLPTYTNYYFPYICKNIDCVENANGEFVPRYELEERVDD